MKSVRHQRGFTLVELLVVIAIISILSIVGVTVFTGIQKSAGDTKKKADIDAITKAYETKYNGAYQVLSGGDFASGSKPTPLEGGDYTGWLTSSSTPASPGFRICAALANNPSPNCNTPSATCYCKESTQEGYIATALPSSTPTPSPTSSPSPTPTSTPTPTFTPTPTPGPWYNIAWAHRKPITINHNQVSGGSNLTSFPVLINLTSDSNLATWTQNSGNDILFTSADAVTKLNHEIERFTQSSGQLVAWVQVPVLSTTTDTLIYMYFGNSSASNQQNKTGVWDSNYKAVYHLGETGACAVTFADSTSTPSNGSCGGVPTANSAAKIDGGRTFGGSADYITVTDGSGAKLDLDANPITIESWINTNSATTVQSILLRGLANGIASGTNGWGMWVNSTGAINVGSAGGGNFNSSSTISASTWTHVVAVVNGSSSAIYINGVDKTPASHTVNVIASNSDLIMGAARNSAGTAFGNYFNGSLDEMRVSNSARSAGWIITEYNNQSNPSTFYSLGAMQ